MKRESVRAGPFWDAGGSMGVEYKAKDTKLGSFVTLKLLPDGIAQTLKLRNASNPKTAQPRRSAILTSARFTEIGEHEDKPLIVLEHLEGQTHKHRIGMKPLKTDELATEGIFPVASGVYLTTRH